MLAEGVFKNLVMRVVVDKQPDEGSDTADFLEQLKELSNLHFKAITPNFISCNAASSFACYGKEQ